MATWQDVRRLALRMPDVVEPPAADGLRGWQVKGKTFVWERPLRRADLAALGDAAPRGPVLGAHVADLGVRAALIAEDPHVYFTTPHFAGYAAVLAQLDDIRVPELTELVEEAWLARAPKRLRQQWLDRRDAGQGMS